MMSPLRMTLCSVYITPIVQLLCCCIIVLLSCTAGTEALTISGNEYLDTVDTPSCHTVSYGHEFSATPYVFTTLEHRTTDTTHEPPLNWVTMRNTTHFRACIDECVTCGAQHSDITLSWMALDSAPNSNSRVGIYSHSQNPYLQTIPYSSAVPASARAFITLYYSDESGNVFPVAKLEDRTTTSIQVDCKMAQSSASAATVEVAYLILSSSDLPNSLSRIGYLQWSGASFVGTDCRDVSYAGGSLQVLPEVVLVSLNHVPAPNNYEMTYVWVEAVTLSYATVCLREWDQTGDSYAHSQNAAVDLFVGSFAHPPVAASDTATISVEFGETASVVFDPTSNDSDVDGDALTATITGTPQYGTVTPLGGNSFNYTLSSGYCSASDSFEYEIEDPSGLTDTATITIDSSVGTDKTAVADAIEYNADVNAADKQRYQLQLNYSSMYDVYVNVSFPESSTPGYCDFTSTDTSGNPRWGFDVSDTGCVLVLMLDVSVQEMLAKCGFVQDLNDRGDDRVHFVQTVSVFTARTRSNLVRQDYIATSETQFTIDLGVSRNVTAVVENLQVYGAPVDLSLLGNAQVVVSDVTSANDADGSYEYELRGDAVTSVQWPYRLEYVSNSLDDSVFNVSTLDITVDTFCDDSDSHIANATCQQIWSFTVDLRTDVACITVDALDNHQANFTFAVNCSDLFEGECAPAFTPTPLATMTISTPDFCPSSSSLALLPSLSIYAYGDASETDTSIAAPTSGAGSFFSTSSDAPPSAFREENLFVYDASMFGEVSASVQQDAATISSLTVLRITTTPTNFGAINVYTYDPDTSAETRADADIVVQNTGFGTASYSNSRARFMLPLNSDTVNRGAQQFDESETFALSVYFEVTFAEASGFDSNSPIGTLLFADRVKSRRGHTELQAGNSADPERSTATTIASVSSVANPGSPTATSSSGGFALSSNAMTVGGAGIALIAIVALVVIAVRRGDDASKPETSENAASIQLSTLPTSSSSAGELPMFAPMETGMTGGSMMMMTNAMEAAPLGLNTMNNLASISDAYMMQQ
jgi:Bacterial Ig domain